VALPPFQDLVDAYARDVSRLARALAGPQAAEDAAQAAWLQALAAYPSLRHARNLRGWLLTITARAAMDQHRARARAPIPLPELPDHPTPLTENTADGVWATVRGLPERQRTAIALRYVLDLAHPDIAAAMATTEGATRRLVSDGLKALRAALPPPERTADTQGAHR
jgi:RNA polymerase sigma factor (sigma-70 family)